ncbi:MAG: hypothetical protein KDM81_05230 [Verrucomicrobiae bacterium]|nr:hypothetical protein [Verrucomicrobiae bacterium]MCP5522200.1 hypothetical protein [Verrucomicrobiales bacterium]
MLDGLFIAGAAGQMAQANRAESTADRAAHAASEVRRENESLRLDVEKLFLITRALWTLLQEQHGYTEEQLIQRIQEIDLEDGRLDGRIAQERPDCPQCGRKLIGQRPVCLYCGAAVVLGPFQR